MKPKQIDILLYHLKNTIAAVIVRKNGYSSMHYLSYVSDPVNGSIECYDNFLERNVTIKLDDISSLVESGAFEKDHANDKKLKQVRISTLKASIEGPCADITAATSMDELREMGNRITYKYPTDNIDDLKEYLIEYLHEIITVVPADVLRWFMYRYFNIVVNTADIDDIKQMWIEIIREYRNRGLNVLDTESDGTEDSEFLEEVEIIKQLLKDVPQVAAGELDKCNTKSEVFAYWPSLLYPRPSEITYTSISQIS